MERAFPEVPIEDYEKLIDALEHTVKDDRHVRASAIQTKASVIVTDNIKDFPAEILLPHDIVAIGLDDFIADILDMADVEATAAPRIMRERFQNPDIDAEDLILRIEKLGLTQMDFRVCTATGDPSKSSSGIMPWPGEASTVSLPFSFRAPCSGAMSIVSIS